MKTMVLGGITRNARIEKANKRSPKKSPSQYFISLEKVFSMEDQHMRRVDRLVSTGINIDYFETDFNRYPPFYL